MNETQLTSDTGGLVEPGPRRTSAATVGGTSASAPTTPTGRTTVGAAFSISYEQGNRALVQAEPRVWIEVDPMGGTLYDFAETSRDDWSIMLHDESRDTRLQIDLHRRMIRCKQGSGDWIDLYQILDARTG